MDAHVNDVARVLAQLRGSVIESAEETEDGAHLRLADGRLIVFSGEFVIAICAPKKRTLQ